MMCNIKPKQSYCQKPVPVSTVYINSSRNTVSLVALFGLKLITDVGDETFPTNCCFAFKKKKKKRLVEVRFSNVRLT